jgi:hypothetical protein
MFFLPFSWQLGMLMVSVVAIGNLRYSVVRNGGYRSGQAVSYYMTRVPGWETYCEPLVCKQLSRLFIFTNALLEGLGSDNADKGAIEMILLQCRQDIARELAQQQDDDSGNVELDHVEFFSSKTHATCE